MAEEKKQGEQKAEIKMVSVSLADLAADEEEEEGGEQAEEKAAQPEQKKTEAEKGGAGKMSDLLDDIFAEEADENDRMKVFGDLEHLTMVEVAAEVEAVLEELRIRQGGHE